MTIFPKLAVSNFQVSTRQQLNKMSNQITNFCTPALLETYNQNQSKKEN